MVRFQVKILQNLGSLSRILSSFPTFFILMSFFLHLQIFQKSRISPEISRDCLEKQGILNVLKVFSKWDFGVYEVILCFFNSVHDAQTLIFKRCITVEFCFRGHEKSLNGINFKKIWDHEQQKISEKVLRWKEWERKPAISEWLIEKNKKCLKSSSKLQKNHQLRETNIYFQAQPPIFFCVAFKNSSISPPTQKMFLN